MAPLRRALALSSLVCAGVMADDSCSVDDNDKADCNQNSEDSCNQAGCCWKPAGQGSVTPWCYYKKGQAPTVPHCSLKSDPKAPWTADEISQIRQLFEANLDIQGSGMVVAAPDHNTGPGGDYYYAWQRDGALSMNAFMETSPSFDGDVETKMEHWLAWVERSTEAAEKDSNPDQAMAEPKYVIPSGEKFPGNWCRPQNDGPGLRAITLMNYAAKKADMAGRIWSTVQKQLDWTAKNYASTGCDLWEEIQSNDFFWNRYTARKALLMGSKFAAAQNDSDRASNYEAKGKEIEGQLQNHVQADHFVFESENRKQDVAVIEAFNVGDMSDGIFDPLSNEVVTTMVGLSNLFCKDFGLNQQAASSNISGILYGRYAGDTYDGGNPWILLSASVSTLLYKQSAAIASGSKMMPEVADKVKPLLAVGDTIITAQNLLGAGDAIFNRMKTFMNNGLHMNEQIGRDDGQLKSAKDLTWNYANVLKAMKARAAAVGSMEERIIV